MTDTSELQYVDAWYLTRNGWIVDDALTWTEEVTGRSRHGGHAGTGLGSYTATRVMIALSLYDPPSTYPGGDPYVGSIDGVRELRVYRDQQERLFVLRRKERHHLQPEVAAAVEAFIERGGVKDDSPRTVTPEPEAQTIEERLLAEVTATYPNLIEMSFPGFEPTVYIPAGNYGDGWTDFILLGDGEAMKFTITPDGELEHYWLDGHDK